VEFDLSSICEYDYRILILVNPADGDLAFKTLPLLEFLMKIIFGSKPLFFFSYFCYSRFLCTVAKDTLGFY
jgi:hypothetical protein